MRTVITPIGSEEGKWDRKIVICVSMEAKVRIACFAKALFGQKIVLICIFESRILSLMSA